MLVKGVPVSSITIMYNKTDIRARRINRELLTLSKEYGISVIDLGDAPDVVVVVGGDGTLLRAFHLTHGEYPILGILDGTFGTLMEVERENLDRTLHQMVSGDYWVEEVSVLETVDPVSLIALNEVLIRSGKIGKSSRIGFGVDGAPVNECICDALLVSTPTGSLAYSLATGGPVIDPRVEGMIVSMVAPWPPSLQVSFSSLVIPKSSMVEVWDPSPQVYIVVDGLSPVKVSPPVKIRTSDSVKARFVRASQDPGNFYRRIIKRMSPKPLTGIMDYLRTGLSPSTKF